MMIKTLKSIADSLRALEYPSEPTICTREFCASAIKLASCYKSRADIAFFPGKSDLSSLRSDALYIEDGCLFLLVSIREFAREENFPPSPTVNSYKTKWEGGAFPKEWVLSRFQILIDKGFPYQLFEPFFESEGGLMYVYTPMYKLIGYYHQKYPVFELEVELEDFLGQQPAYHQGNLRLYPLVEFPITKMRWWRSGRWFFNHWIGDEEPDAYNAKGIQITTEGIVWNGAPFAVLFLHTEGDTIIHSKDHEDIEVPTGDYLVVHSLLND